MLNEINKTLDRIGFWSALQVATGIILGLLVVLLVVTV